MVVVEKKRRRGFAVPFAMGGVILFSLQAIVYILILDDTIGGVSFAKRPRALSPDLLAVLLRSDAIAAQWDDPEPYHAALERWEDLLQREEINYRVASERELGEALRDAAVLVLPGATCLGEAERRAVEAFLEKGRGVVATGALGSRDATCAWVGWDFLQSYTGARAATAVTPEGGAFATFRGDQFYADRVPAGYRLEIPHQELSVVELDDPDAYWSDWRLRPARGDAVSGVALAAHRILPSGGRSVWLGFGPDPYQREGGAADEVLRGYLFSAVAWAGHQAIAHLASWPDAAPSAALVNVLVEPGDGVDSLAPELLQRDVPVTFAVSPEQPVGTLTALAASGEIAARGIDDGSLAGQRLEQQRKRLADARERLQAATRSRIAGLWPPEGVTDHLTPRAMDDAGLSYTLGEVAGIRGTPELVPRPRLLFPRAMPGVVRMFQAAHDDLEVLAGDQEVPASDDSLTRGFLWDFERLHYLGGLYPLTLHAGLLAPEQQQRVVSRLIEEFRKRGAWITTGSELSEWWAARSQLRVTVSRLSAYRLQLDVANHGQTDVPRVSAYIYLSHRPETVSLRSPVFRLTPPRYSLQQGEPILRVDLEGLDRQTNQSYMVVLDE